MDSLTQITLGAAVGEAVLGKKIGNKAMLWGGIAGTLPDLDIFANAVADEVSALAFHRAMTHSLFFAALAPLMLGWLTHRLYRDGPRRQWWARWVATWLFFWLLLLIGVAVMPIPWFEGLAIVLAVSFSLVFLPGLVGVSRLIRKKGVLTENPSPRAWMWLFFWSIVTHPLLDACTTYGTQLWRPFSSFRVALNNISVVDPLYTLPFLLCLLIAAFLRRGSKERRLFNTLGIVLSSLYMLFTFYNKYRVDQVFANSLQKQAISYQRFTAAPTIFNNVLWQGVAEGDTAFYYGMYSLLDAQPQISSFSIIPKGHERLKGYEKSRDLGILQWFSNGYYTVSERNGQLYFNDLRFGALDIGGETNEPRFVFQFRLQEENGVLRARQTRETPEMQGALEALWERLRGVDN